LTTRWAKLSAIMFEGPDDILRLTENAQPALMAVSVAVTRVLEAAAWRSRTMQAYVAGHSLGEYSALCGRRRVQPRRYGAAAEDPRTGHAAGRAGRAGRHGGDPRARSRDSAEAANEAAQGEVCGVANDNAPGQVVISGHAGAVERAIELAKAKPVPSAPCRCRSAHPSIAP
jgi:[acyl-carrier-protein] S-malonyltransferase